MSNVSLEQRKDLIFGYPPIIYNEEQKPKSNSLWKHVGKHIYGNPTDDMQIRLMLIEYDALEN